MSYDAYKDVPDGLRPTTMDAVALTELAMTVKEAVRVRHDFHTAIHVSDTMESVRRAFVPLILQPPGPSVERHLKGPPAWESSFANTARPDAKTTAGLAGRHRELALEAKAQAARIKGNQALGKFVKDNLDALFPEIGFSVATGSALRRLRKDDKSVLQIFHPLGVEDPANIIRLLLRKKQGMYYYW